MEIILPQAPMLTPSAKKIQAKLYIRNSAGTIGVESKENIWSPIASTSLVYIKADMPTDIPEAMIPIIMPSHKNGPLINQLVAPTYFIIFISFALLNTVNFIVLDTTTIDTIIRNTN